MVGRRWVPAQMVLEGEVAFCGELAEVMMVLSAAKVFLQ